MVDRLKQYRGTLTPKQIADGMNAANQNADRLLEDARLLFENGKYASSLTLAILAIEESGKPSILRALSTTRDGKEQKEEWKRYRSHRAKNAHWILVDLAQKGAKSLKDFAKIADPKSDHPELLDQLKQASLYSDCLGNCHWSLPVEIISEELAAGMLQAADILAKKSPHTTEEIELWKKHIGPVIHLKHHEQQQALRDWFAEMKGKGLISEGKVKFEDFLNA